ncbi:SGL domain-containing protein [Nitrospira tepida]|uniref:SGL domain-containing protein n=2 Tax=Nitrospira tepida TaxID=2973512 RepID=A0AA86MXG5_9BACT|nr:SGL domain-containing protein [Nitrospira tepida]
MQAGEAMNSSVSLDSGIITTIAGVGESGCSGDGGPALLARLNEPKQVAVDVHGNLYIADAENHLIRKVEAATGVITTVAGRGESGASIPSAGSDHVSEVTDGADEDPLSDPVPQTEGRFAQLADLGGTVRFVVGKAQDGSAHYAGDEGPAVKARLNFPSAVAVDADGTLFIADTMNHRVRRVDARTGIITTIAGTGQRRFSGEGGPAVKAALNEPAALALDGRGGLYVADQSNNRVRRIDLATGVIVTVAGTGEAGYTGDGMPAIEAGLAGPSGLAWGEDGTLYVADTFNGRIRAVDSVTGVIRTVAGDGGEYRYQGVPNEWSTSLSRPYGIAVDREGHLLITDSDSHLLRRWDRRKKIITRLVGTGQARFGGDGGPASDASLNYPFGVAIDGAGHVYIADTFNHRIRKLIV